MAWKWIHYISNDHLFKNRQSIDTSNDLDFSDSKSYKWFGFDLGDVKHEKRGELSIRITNRNRNHRRCLAHLQILQLAGVLNRKPEYKKKYWILWLEPFFYKFLRHSINKIIKYHFSSISFLWQTKFRA